MAIDTLATNPIESLGAGRAILHGRFAPNGNSAVTGVAGDRSFAATRNSTGQYTCTFDVPDNSTILDARATLNDAGATDRNCRITGLAQTGNGTVTIVVRVTVYS